MLPVTPPPPSSDTGLQLPHVESGSRKRRTRHREVELGTGSNTYIRGVELEGEKRRKNLISRMAAYRRESSVSKQTGGVQANFGNDAESGRMPEPPHTASASLINPPELRQYDQPAGETSSNCGGSPSTPAIGSEVDRSNDLYSELTRNRKRRAGHREVELGTDSNTSIRDVKRRGEKRRKTLISRMAAYRGESSVSKQTRGVQANFGNDAESERMPEPPHTASASLINPPELRQYDQPAGETSSNCGGSPSTPAIGSEVDLSNDLYSELTRNRVYSDHEESQKFGAKFYEFSVVAGGWNVVFKQQKEPTGKTNSPPKHWQECFANALIHLGGSATTGEIANWLTKKDSINFPVIGEKIKGTWAESMRVTAKRTELFVQDGKKWILNPDSRNIEIKAKPSEGGDVSAEGVGADSMLVLPETVSAFYSKMQEQREPCATDPARYSFKVVPAQPQTVVITDQCLPVGRHREGQKYWTQIVANGLANLGGTSTPLMLSEWLMVNHPDDFPRANQEKWRGHVRDALKDSDVFKREKNIWSFNEGSGKVGFGTSSEISSEANE